MVGILAEVSWPFILCLCCECEIHIVNSQCENSQEGFVMDPTLATCQPVEQGFVILCLVQLESRGRAVVPVSRRKFGEA